MKQDRKCRVGQIGPKQQTVLSDSREKVCSLGREPHPPL